MESQNQENQENQLAVIVNDSGLDKTKSQILLDQFSNYFEIAATWENKAKTLIVTDINQKTEMKMAREGRLFLKAKRVDIEKARKELKEQSLREGQTIDAIAKILKNLIEPIEQHLEKQEKFAEIKEKEMKEERKVTREATLTELGFDYTYTDLLNMPDIQFDELVLKIENEISAKQEADRLAKLETERLENIKKLKEERTLIAMPYYHFWSELEKTLNFGEVEESDFLAFIDKCKNDKAKFDEDQEKIRLENERLQEEVRQNEEKQQVRKNRDKKRDAELAPYIVFIRDYSGMLEMEDDDYNKELAGIKIAKKQQDDFNASEQLRINGEVAKRSELAVEFLSSIGYKRDEFGMSSMNYSHFIGINHYCELDSDNELELFKQGVIATKEREEANEKTRLETAKNEELTKKLLLKQQEDAKIAKANELAKKKAAAAPDKDKLTALIASIKALEMPMVATGEASRVIADVSGLLDKVCTFIEQKRDQL